jgi:hypothetical protein
LPSFFRSFIDLYEVIGDAKAGIADDSTIIDDSNIINVSNRAAVFLVLFIMVTVYHIHSRQRKDA